MFLFANTMIVYVENPRESTKKFLELINEFSKDRRYKLNIPKSMVFLQYILATINWKWNLNKI